MSEWFRAPDLKFASLVQIIHDTAIWICSWQSRVQLVNQLAFLIGYVFFAIFTVSPIITIELNTFDISQISSFQLILCTPTDYKQNSYLFSKSMFASVWTIYELFPLLSLFTASRITTTTPPDIFIPREKDKTAPFRRLLQTPFFRPHSSGPLPQAPSSGALLQPPFLRPKIQ